MSGGVEEEPSRRRLTRRRVLGLGAAGAGVLGAAVAVAEARPRGDLVDLGAARPFDDRDFAANPPFSFSYDDRPSADLLGGWPHELVQRRLSGRDQRTTTWTDPATGLQVECRSVHYDSGAVEWTVLLRNTGRSVSGRVTGLLAADVRLGTSAADVTLHSFRGSTASATDFAPVDTVLARQDRQLLSSRGGRPSNGTWPYFSLDWGRQGVMVAVGWPGQWTVELQRDAAPDVTLRAAMTSADPESSAHDSIAAAGLVSTTLEPGEEIRTPLIAVLPWRGRSWTAAQNLWRRWMLEFNLPRRHGRLPPPILPTGAVDGHYPGLLDTAADELAWLAAYDAHETLPDRGGPYTHWWMDAGWYQLAAGGTDWTAVGTWEPDPVRYPDGLRPVTDAARADGLAAIVWHEPERVRAGSWLDGQPAWLIDIGREDRLLDLGNPSAWGWLVDHLDRLLTTQGVDVYRQDFNLDPLAYWNQQDTEERSGMTQIKHVVGYLSLLDELRRRHPDLIIDSCASGGRRNDLETMRRAVPLLRSDYQFEPVGQQGHTYGLSFWLPYYGAGVGPQALAGTGVGDPQYVMRSSFAPCYASSVDRLSAKAADWALLGASNAEFAQFAEDLLADYYPLTPYRSDTGGWLAMQFDDPERGHGVVLAFRRSAEAPDSLTVGLQGLSPGARYQVRDLDAVALVNRSGRELGGAGEGLALQRDTAPAAVVVVYRRSD